MAQSVILDPLVLQALIPQSLAQQDRQAHKAHKEFKALLVLQALKVFKAFKANKALLDLPGHKAFKA
jgi:hypothetical protein